MWNKRLVFPPSAANSVGDGTMDLSTDMSEMNLAECQPRPRKIRRRNALTIMDHQLPSPTMGLQRLDSFESASLLQSLEEQVNFDAGSESVSDQMPGPSPFHRNVTPPKRKLPRARLKSSSPTFKQKHRLKEEITHIRLHQDLASHKMNTELLPESIVKGYRDQYQSGLLAATSSSPKPSTALVLYTPPEKLLSSILSNDSAENSSAKDKNKKEPCEDLRPIGKSKNVDADDVEML